MTWLRYICTGILGLVFCLSSVFKLMDPVGTRLIVDAYLDFLHLTFLAPASPFIGGCLSVCEATIGIGLLTGVWRRFFAWATFCFVAFFTLISILLLIFNPEMDCGCFGEAIPLTHRQTFVKNVILLALSFVAFVPMRNLDLMSDERMIAFVSGMVIMAAFTIIAYFQPPFGDYTEYAASNTIVDEDDPMAGSPGNPLLPVFDAYGNDCSANILEGDVVLVSCYSPDKLDQSDLLEIADFSQRAMDAGYMPYVLSTSALDVPGVETYIADYKTLITLNRSNGGLVFLDEGYIVSKHSSYFLPSYDELSKMIGMDSNELYIEIATEKTVLLQGFIILFLAVILLV